jgi:hypothetical protein
MSEFSQEQTVKTNTLWLRLSQNFYDSAAVVGVEDSSLDYEEEGVKMKIILFLKTKIKSNFNIWSYAIKIWE